MSLIRVPKFRVVNVKREGRRVLLIEEGQLRLDLDYTLALEVAKAITAQAKRAEEEVKANDIILDNAFLLRAGIPIGLSDRPDIIKESLKEAAHNTELRRQLPGGIKSTAVVGTPSVVKHEPKEN